MDNRLVATKPRSTTGAMRAWVRLAAAALLALPASAPAAQQVVVPATPVDDISPKLCVSAMENGDRLWLGADGTMIVRFRDAYYFVSATPTALTCSAVRYLP